MKAHAAPPLPRNHGLDCSPDVANGRAAMSYEEIARVLERRHGKKVRKQAIHNTCVRAERKILAALKTEIFGLV